MAEIRINTTGGLKLYDADNSHYAQILAGTITSNVDAITLGHNLATFNAAVTAGGILKTDDTTDATSTTDGSLQTDGGLSVAKDAIIGDDLKLLSDSAVLSLGAGSDATFTHDGTTGLTIAATPISIDATGELHLNSTTGDIKLQDGGTDQIAFDLDGTAGEVIMKPAVDSDDLVISQYDGTEVIRIEDNASLGLVGNKLSIANSSSDVVIKPLTDAKDIIFQQYDGTVVATVEDNATFNIPASKLAIGGTAVTATAAEMNLLDGGTSVGSSITLADADGFVVNDGGTMKTIPASDINTYASGNLVKLAQANSLTNTATINIDSVFSSVYTAYRFLCTFKAVNSDVHCTFRWRDGGSDLTVSQYYGSARGGYVDGSGAGAQSFSDWGSSSAKVADSMNNNNYNGLHLDMLLYPYNNTGVANIASVDNASNIVWHAQYWADPDREEQVSGGNTYTQTTVPDGFGFDLSGGDFDGYNYALFGYKG